MKLTKAMTTLFSLMVIGKIRGWSVNGSGHCGAMKEKTLLSMCVILLTTTSGCGSKLKVMV